MLRALRSIALWLLRRILLMDYTCYWRLYRDSKRGQSVEHLDDYELIRFIMQEQKGHEYWEIVYGSLFKESEQEAEEVDGGV